MGAQRLEGKVALVTGSGRGIGRAVALTFAAAGAAVGLAARTRDELELARTEIEAAGGRAWSFPTDVAEDGAAARLVPAVEDRIGPLDILVNAAGISPVFVRSEHISSEDWDAIMATNLRAAFLLCQAAAAGMLERRRGSIVNVASVGATVALPRLAAYCASKAGLVALTRVLAVEWADRGVRVNAIAPAYVRTDMASSRILNSAQNSSPVPHSVALPNPRRSRLPFTSSSRMRPATRQERRSTSMEGGPPSDG